LQKLKVDFKNHIQLEIVKFAGFQILYALFLDPTALGKERKTHHLDER